MIPEPEKMNTAFRDIPYMGVIWVVAEAMKLGFYNGHPDWCNLGQGQPEVGDIEGAPPRITHIDITPEDQAYGPINGTDELRETVAAYYNRLYRKGKSSQFTAENVSVAMGGRLALSRIFTALNKLRLGYQVPDYTAYEDMMKYQLGRVEPVRVPTRMEDGFGIPGSKFGSTIRELDLDAYLFSNPCNPTGNLIAGDELEEYVRVCRANDCTLISDEFYSHFIYDGDRPGKEGVSTAAYLEDVNKDPVLIIDGLTKSFRYPGWRIGWAVGPKDMIEVIERASSAIDGGPSRPMQRAALQVLEPQQADQATEALRNVFCRKRNLMIESLQNMGIKCYPETKGTFYVWADISNLPDPINDSGVLFTKALKRKVMTVPGPFFDVNPLKGENGDSPFRQWVRFSFGPPEDNVRMGLQRLAEMIGSY